MIANGPKAGIQNEKSVIKCYCSVFPVEKDTGGHPPVQGEEAMLSFEYIRYFLEACDSGSIQAASKKLFLSSQGLGAGIQRLENSLGLKLLIRSKTGVMPTRFGREFYRYAARLIKDMDELEAFCEEYRKSKKTTILIGIVGESKFEGTVALCAELYNKANPDSPSDVTAIQFENNSALLEALRSGDVDAAWMFHSTEQDGLVYHRIDDYSPLVLICGAGSEPAARESVSIQELGSLRFIQAGKNDSITDIVNALFAEAGLREDVFMYTTENSMIGKLIDNDIACILLRECYTPSITRHCTRCAVIPLDPEVKVALSLVSLSSLPHRSVKHAFFDFMAEYLRKHLYSDR